MKVYSVVWFNQGIQELSLRDTLEELGQAVLFDNLEKAKAEAEKHAWSQHEENKAWEAELQGSDFDPPPEPKMEWRQDPKMHGQYQLDPWGQANSQIEGWTPGWWAIREIEVG